MRGLEVRMMWKQGRYMTIFPSAQKHYIEPRWRAQRGEHLKRLPRLILNRLTMHSLKRIPIDRDTGMVERLKMMENWRVVLLVVDSLIEPENVDLTLGA